MRGGLSLSSSSAAHSVTSDTGLGAGQVLYLFGFNGGGGVSAVCWLLFAVVLCNACVCIGACMYVHRLLSKVGQTLPLVSAFRTAAHLVAFCIYF